MDLIKKLENELTLDWQALLLETNLLLKAAALKAYHLKLSLFKKNRAWQMELALPLK